MSFMNGFTKIADAEADDYKKYGPIADAVDKLPSPSKEPGATDLKVGARVCYQSERGWKEGPRGSHQKGCSVDEANREAKKAYEEQVRAEVKETHQKDMAWKVISDRVEKKFPDHCRGDWNTTSVHIGDQGTVTQVHKWKTQSNRYHVTWDKHPDCEWGYYWPKDLKILPE